MTCRSARSSFLTNIIRVDSLGIASVDGYSDYKSIRSSFRPHLSKTNNPRTKWLATALKQNQIIRASALLMVIVVGASCGHTEGDRALSGAGIGAGAGVGAALLGAPLLPAVIIGGAVGAATGAATSDKQINLDK